MKIFAKDKTFMEALQSMKESASAAKEKQLGLVEGFKNEIVKVDSKMMDLQEKYEETFDPDILEEIAKLALHRPTLESKISVVTESIKGIDKSYVKMDYRKEINRIMKPVIEADKKYYEAITKAKEAEVQVDKAIEAARLEVKNILGNISVVDQEDRNVIRVCIAAIKRQLTIVTNGWEKNNKLSTNIGEISGKEDYLCNFPDENKIARGEY